MTGTGTPHMPAPLLPPGQPAAFLNAGAVTGELRGPSGRGLATEPEKHRHQWLGFSRTTLVFERKITCIISDIF